MTASCRICSARGRGSSPRGKWAATASLSPQTCSPSMMRNTCRPKLPRRSRKAGDGRRAARLPASRRPCRQRRPSPSFRFWGTVGAGLGREKTRQVAPNIPRGFDLFAADRKHLALHLAPAEALVKKAPGIVAQHPDDHRAAALIDEPLEQCEQQPPTDPLILPVGGDIKGKDLAGKFRLATAAAAAAETEDMSVLVDRDAHIVRFALDDGRPAKLAPLRRQPDEKRRRQDAGVGRTPGLDIEPRDAARVAWPSAADRYLVHAVALCPVSRALGRALLPPLVNVTPHHLAAWYSRHPRIMVRRWSRSGCSFWRSWRFWSRWRPQRRRRKRKSRRPLPPPLRPKRPRQRRGRRNRLAKAAPG